MQPLSFVSSMRDNCEDVRVLVVLRMLYHINNFSFSTQAMPCGVGPEKLTLLQVVDSTAQSLMSARLTSASPSMPSLHLRHVPDQVLPWPEVIEEACAFRESLADTPAMYDAYVPTTMQPDGEETTLFLLDTSLFPVVNQLRNAPGLAAIKYNEYPEGFDLPGKVLTCQLSLRSSCNQSCNLFIHFLAVVC